MPPMITISPDDRVRTGLNEPWRMRTGLPCANRLDEYFSSNARINRSAADACHDCPVMLDCRRYALENFEVYGVWGGTVPSERLWYWYEKGISISYHTANYIARNPGGRVILR